MEVYDEGDHYSPSTGVYTVPYDGLYHVHAQVYGVDNWASHTIRVNHNAVTFTRQYDPDSTNQVATTSIVLHLSEGDQVAVRFSATGTVHGIYTEMRSFFWVTLLYPY